MGIFKLLNYFFSDWKLSKMMPQYVLDILCKYQAKWLGNKDLSRLNVGVPPDHLQKPNQIMGIFDLLNYFFSDWKLSKMMPQYVLDTLGKYQVIRLEKTDLSRLNVGVPLNLKIKN